MMPKLIRLVSLPVINLGDRMSATHRQTDNITHYLGANKQESTTKIINTLRQPNCLKQHISLAKYDQL